MPSSVAVHPGSPVGPGSAASGSATRPHTAARSGFAARHPAWPVTALLVGYPLWWALGLADFMWIILAAPMISQMVAWHTRGDRRLRVPPRFGIWLLFLIVAAAGIAAISLTAPGTVASPVSHRVLSYINRLASYGGLTVLLLYTGNLTEQELSRRRLAWMLGLVGLYAVAGGLAGMVMPHLQFTSPLLHLLPKSARVNPYIQASMEPGLSQVQNVLGSAAGRPKAPFDYTNTWGDCLTILLPFLFIGWWSAARKRQLVVLALAVLAIVPLLYSLNRGAWIGAGVSIGYLAIRFALRGKTALLAGLAAIIAIGALLIVVTPLKGVITGRLQHGKSNNLRANLSSLSVTDALASPIIGFGDTRQEQGSPNSIAIGPSLKCPTCGQLAVGSTGQLWLLLVSNGVLGAALYLAFFASGIWYYRRDQSPEALAGILVLVLSFVYMFTYDAVPAPLGFTMLAYALMWKNAVWARRAGRVQSPEFHDLGDFPTL
ncbi:MAG TPA: hypothetical protein VN695_09525 [Streptosporangiaceae bacterium]|nr:hypothetical protein [Streptosporangiaceae bacterium]